MSFRIEDGTGHGYTVEVTSQNRLKVASKSGTLQFHHSSINGETYQINSGVQTVSSAGAYGILAIKNASLKYAVVTYIRVGVDVTETSQVKFEIMADGTWVDEGSAATEVNMNFGSANSSGMTNRYNATPTDSTLMDVCFLKGPSEMRYNKEGSIIIAPGKCFSIKATTETNNAKIYARVSCVMMTLDQLIEN